MSIRKSDKCRLCFSPGIFHINIFDTTKNIVEVIQEIFHSEINEYDSLPNFICVDCWMTIQNFHKYYRKVLTAQENFLIERQPPIKLEPETDYFGEAFIDTESINPPTNSRIEQISVSALNVKQNDDSESDNRSEDDEENSTHFDGLGSNEIVSDSESEDASDSDDFQYKEDKSDDDFDIKSFLSGKRKTEVIYPDGKRKRGRPPKAVKTVRIGRRGHFDCPYCDKWFTRRHRVAVHIQGKHGHQCDQCEYKAQSELKLKQHKHTHDPEFEGKLRKRVEETIMIDINAVDENQVEIILKKFDMSCDNCSMHFQTLNEAQVHYPKDHDIPKGYLKCCGMKFYVESMVKEHITYHSNPEDHYCFVCDTTIKAKSHLRSHLKRHVTELLENHTWKCDICLKIYASEPNLRYHKAEVHTNKSEQIKCDICSKVLCDVPQMIKHMRNAHETTTQELQEFVSSNFNMACDICETIFDSLTHAKSHYLNDHDEPKGYLKCCDIKLRSLREVEEHVDWHKNPGQHKCHLCDQVFKAKNHLKTHIRRHNRTFTCELCGKRFKRRTGLTSHIKHVHEPAPRNFPCRFCSIRFVTDEKREAHEQLIHYGNTTVARMVCDICGRGFLQTCHLVKHMEKCHTDKEEKKPKEISKNEKCTICGLWLSSRYRLKLHRKSHSDDLNKCHICGVEAPNHEALLGHVRAFHIVRKKNKCRLCDLTFQTQNDLQDHIIANHPEEKLHECGICQKSFVWKVSLDAHLKKTHTEVVPSDT